MYKYLLHECLHKHLMIEFDSTHREGKLMEVFKIFLRFHIYLEQLQSNNYFSIRAGLMRQNHLKYWNFWKDY